MPSRKRAQICHGRPAQIGHKRLISRELLHRTLGRIVSSCDESRVFASFFGSPYGALQIPTPAAYFGMQHHGLGANSASLRQCFSRAFRIAKHLSLRLHPSVC